MAVALGAINKPMQDGPPEGRHDRAGANRAPGYAAASAAAAAAAGQISVPGPAVPASPSATPPAPVSSTPQSDKGRSNHSNLAADNGEAPTATNGADAAQSSPATAARKGLRLARVPTGSSRDIDGSPSQQTPTSATATLSTSRTNSSTDPLSQHIFMRTADVYKPSRLRNPPTRPETPASGTAPAPGTDDAAKFPTLHADFGREKEKRKGFLGRLSMRTNRRKGDANDNGSENEEPRTEGSNARVFASIAGSGGYMPHHKEPPRYIRVKTHEKKTKEFDRMFLAQELVGTRPLEQEADGKAPVVTISSPGYVRKRAATGGAVWTTEFSKDGKYLAAGGRGHVVRVWAVLSTADERRIQEEELEAEDGGAGERLSAPVFLEKPVREFDEHTGDILDLSWSKNNFLLSTAMDKTVRLWHISRKECLCTFKHKELVSKVAFHPTDDRFFLAGCLDAVLRLWSIPDKSIAFSAQLPDMITAVAFSPDGKVSIAGLLNSHCHFFETEGLKPQSQMHVRSSRGRNAKGSKITGIVTMATPGAKDGEDAKVLITSTDSRVRVYNLRDKTLDCKLKGHEHATTQLCASFSDDGKYVICGSEDRKAFVWSMDAAEGLSKDKRPCEFFNAHSEMVTTAIFAPTKTRQLVGSSGDPIYDLCNPPPVTLMSFEEAMASQTGLSDHTLPHDDASRPAAAPATPAASAAAARSVRAEKTPAYLARSTHYDGNIIVTSDDTGIIKVFRQDCAANKRKHESWETGSAFSRKMTGSSMVGRSGSIIARNSTGSRAHSRRGSLSQPAAQAQAGTSDRIRSWRQDIESNRSRPSSMVGTPTRSERSLSPSKVGRAPAGSLASEARKQPYAATGSSPLSSKFAGSPHAHLAQALNRGHPNAASTAANTAANTASSTAASTTPNAQAGVGQPASASAAEAAVRDSAAPEAETERKGKDKAEPESDGRGLSGPPIPSFSFRSAENEGQQRTDPPGASSYSFWNLNLNKWKGIAGLRSALTGSSSTVNENEEAGSSSGGPGGHAGHSHPSLLHHAHHGILPSSPLAKSVTTAEDSDSGGEEPAPKARAQSRRRSTASGTGHARLVPVSRATTANSISSDDDDDDNNKHLHPLAGERTPYTHDSSVVSKLSSELTNSEGEREGGGARDEDEVPMTCSKCGGRNFKVRTVPSGQMVQCSRCGKEAAMESVRRAGGGGGGGSAAGKAAR